MSLKGSFISLRLLGDLFWEGKNIKSRQKQKIGVGNAKELSIDRSN